MNNQKVLDISWQSIFKIAVAVISFYILFQIRDILIWFIFALIISILFSPAIEALMKLKIPRMPSTILVYFAAFGILSIAFYLIVSVLISEIEQFSQLLPYYFQQLSPTLRDLGIYTFRDIEEVIQTIGGSLRELTTALFSASFALFGGMFTTFFIITLALFLSLEGKIIEKTIILLFPQKYESRAFSLWKKSQEQVNGWFFTRILSCLFVGLAVFISALILGVEYPFSLGLISGILNFIPFIGSLVAGIFIFLIAIMDNPMTAFFIILAFILIQFIENNILMPSLAKKFINLSPVLVVLALAIGGTLWGILGALLAIPLAGILFEFLKEFFKEKKENEIAL